MAIVTICSDFDEFCHCFHCFPISYEVMGPDAWPSFFECWVIRQPFHSPLSPSSRGSLVPYHFLPLECYYLHIWGCWYFSQQSWLQFESSTFCMMYSTYKLNKQSDNIQPSHTPFPILNQLVDPCKGLTIVTWPAYGFLRRQVRWSDIPISLRVFHS